MPRKKKEENTTDSVKKEVTATKCSKYGTEALQQSAMLHVKGLRGKVN